MILFGIPTCDTCRKAQKTLLNSGVPVEFRDIRRHPLTEAEIDAFVVRFGGNILNRKSTTWRALDEAERKENPATLLARHPTLMKRPVIAEGETLHLGWTTEVQEKFGL